MSRARRIETFDRTFEMHRGGELPQLEVAYESWGRLDAERSNAVLIFTGLSPSAHAASSNADPSPGWWEEVVGPGRSIDTRRYFVICVNSLGSCYGSTGPASRDPATGRRYGMDFPVLAIEDIATAGRWLVERLGIERLHTVVGPSMGGMSALAYAMMYPEGLRRLMLISSAARAEPFAIAIRSLQREIIRSDPVWQGGAYADDESPVLGMRLARKLGMISYRSALEWRQRFGRERIPEERREDDPFAIDFEVESYLENHAGKFTGQFDANCYLYLSRAMDLFDAAEFGGSVAKGLARVKAERTLVVGVETDFLFPLHQQEELAEALRVAGREVDFEALPSVQGHDAFLVDMDGFRPVIGGFMDEA